MTNGSERPLAPLVPGERGPCLPKIGKHSQLLLVLLLLAATKPTYGRRITCKPLKELVEVSGFEPLTPCLQSRCSSS
jgi:hypothetical protein